MYILECADRSFYVGSTWDLERRVTQHNDGEGAAYTARRRPVRLVYAEEFHRVDEAFAREKQVQGWGRAKRIALIEGRLEDLPRLSASSSHVVDLDVERRADLDRLDQRRADLDGLDQRGVISTGSISETRPISETGSISETRSVRRTR